MRKIDDERLLELFHSGVPQVTIAAEFQCSPAAVSKRLHRLLPLPDISHLTEKQRTFALEVAKGYSPTEAACRAYDCKDRSSAKVIGSEMMAKSEVKEAISEIMDSVGFTRRFKVQRLMHFAGHADGSVALKAIDMGLKLRDEYPGKGENVVGYNFTQVNLSQILQTNETPQEAVTGETVELDRYFRRATGEDNP